MEMMTQDEAKKIYKEIYTLCEKGEDEVVADIFRQHPFVMTLADDYGTTLALVAVRNKLLKAGMVVAGDFNASTKQNVLGLTPGMVAALSKDMRPVALTILENHKLATIQKDCTEKGVEDYLEYASLGMDKKLHRTIEDEKRELKRNTENAILFKKIYDICRNVTDLNRSEVDGVMCEILTKNPGAELIVGDYGLSVGMLIARNGLIEASRILAENFTACQQQDVFLRTPAHYAGIRGDSKMVGILTNDNPTARNMTDCTGYTPKDYLDYSNGRE